MALQANVKMEIVFIVIMYLAIQALSLAKGDNQKMIRSGEMLLTRSTKSKKEKVGYKKQDSTLKNDGGLECKKQPLTKILF